MCIERKIKSQVDTFTALVACVACIPFSAQERLVAATQATALDGVAFRVVTAAFEGLLSGQ